MTDVSSSIKIAQADVRIGLASEPEVVAALLAEIERLRVLAEESPSE